MSCGGGLGMEKLYHLPPGLTSVRKAVFLRRGELCYCCVPVRQIEDRVEAKPVAAALFESDPTRPETFRIEKNLSVSVADYHAAYIGGVSHSLRNGCEFGKKFAPAQRFIAI